MNLFIFLKVICGGELNDTNGSLSSPDYPQNYANTLRCLWTITVPPKYNIRLNFVSLQTESCNDYVEIFDGNSANTSLDKFCGNLNSRSTTQVTSTSNVMTVKFFTDGSNNYKGFLATYSAIEQSKSQSKLG